MICIVDVAVEIMNLKEIKQGDDRIGGPMLHKMPNKCANLPQLMDCRVGKEENRE